jgi:hypothetical protein
VPENDPLSLVRTILPLRDLPPDQREDVVRQGLGRPRRVEARPEQDTYLERLDELRGVAAEVDPLLSACRDAAQDGKVMEATMVQLARENAALGWERQASERRGADVGQICSRRVAGLTQLANLVSERARLGGDVEVDPRDPRVQAVVKLFFSDIAQVAQETLGTETAETFTSTFLARVKGWEDRLR